MKGHPAKSLALALVALAAVASVAAGAGSTKHPTGRDLAVREGCQRTFINITLVNSQTEKLFGYGQEAVLGKPLATLAPDAQREEVEQQLAGSTHVDEESRRRAIEGAKDIDEAAHQRIGSRGAERE